MSHTPQSIEAKRLLNLKGIAEPSASQINKEIMRFGQEKRINLARERIAQVKEKATRGKVLGTSSESPQQGFPTRSLAGLTPGTSSESPQQGFPTRSLAGLTPGTFEAELQKYFINRYSGQEQQRQRYLSDISSQMLTLPKFEGTRAENLLGRFQSRARGTESLFEGLVGLGSQRQKQLEEQSRLGAQAYKEQLEAQKPGSINEFASKQFGYLVDDKGRAITDAQGKTIDLPAQTDAELEKRRSTARNKFLALREAIGKKGILLNVEAGEKFLKAFEITDNPEKTLNQYMLEAFSRPDVKKAFSKEGGISIKIPGFFKELEYVGNLSDEQIEQFKEASGVLKKIKGTGSIDFDDL